MGDPHHILHREAELLEENLPRRAGAEVILNGRDPAALGEAAARLVDNGALGVKALAFDVTNEESVEDAIAHAETEIGQIDILVNNAGMQHRAPLEDWPLDKFRQVIDTNLTSAFIVGRAVARGMIARRSGKIINISSRLGMPEYVDSNSVPYGVVNAGTNILSIGLARELQESGIRVNTVIPTVTDTDRFRDVFTSEEQQRIIKKGKLGTAEEVAETIVGILKDGKKTGEMVIDPRVRL